MWHTSHPPPLCWCWSHHPLSAVLHWEVCLVTEILKKHFGWKADFLRHSRIHRLHILTLFVSLKENLWIGGRGGMEPYLDVRVWIQQRISSTQVGAFHKHIHNFPLALGWSNLSFSFLDKKKQQSSKNLKLHHQPSSHSTGPGKTWAVWCEGLMCHRQIG